MQSGTTAFLSKSLLAVLILSAIVACQVEPSEGGTPTVLYPISEDFFGGSLSVMGKPVLGQNIELRLVIKPRAKAPNTRIRIWLPEGVELVEGTLEWSGDLVRGQEVVHSVMLRTTQEGEWEISIYAESIFPTGHVETMEYYVYLLSSEQGGEVHRTPVAPIEWPLQQEPAVVP